MQVVTARETSEIGTYTKKLHPIAAAKVKTEKYKIGETKPMKFGDLDDVIRVAEYEMHELYSEIEVLKFKKASPPELCVAENPPILFSLCALEDELEKTRRRIHLLQMEKEFIFKKKKSKK